MMIQPLRIKIGPRVLGIQTAGTVFGGGSPRIFLDCMGCDDSIVATYRSNQEVDSVSDAEAAIMFAEHGWSILPTLCPKCQPKEDGHE